MGMPYSDLPQKEIAEKRKGKAQELDDAIRDIEDINLHLQELIDTLNGEPSPKPDRCEEIPKPCLSKLLAQGPDQLRMYRNKIMDQISVLRDILL